jgi:hypothetical protein
LAGWANDEKSYRHGHEMPWGASSDAPNLKRGVAFDESRTGKNAAVPH